MGFSGKLTNFSQNHHVVIGFSIIYKFVNFYLNHQILQNLSKLAEYECILMENVADAPKHKLTSLETSYMRRKRMKILNALNWNFLKYLTFKKT